MGRYPHVRMSSGLGLRDAIGLVSEERKRQSSRSAVAVQLGVVVATGGGGMEGHEPDIGEIRESQSVVVPIL